ncbi:MAG: glutamate 5-kinase [Deltaproteobacteria bacterium]|nr:glutamate 5-kinase [Deltaproteobacteria bacterium]
MEEPNNFKKYLDSKKRIVIKIGTQVLLNKEGKPSLAAFKNICDFSSALIGQKKEVILVSSGAVAAGKDLLDINPGLNNFSIPQKQAFAACGQPLLMDNYDSCFKRLGIKTAQILLTKEDISVRKRFTNARNTIYELLKNNVVPIINENDTVSYEEIKFSDNDHLSALVLNLVCADLLIILSNVNGVFDKNPNLYKDAKPVKIIGDIKNYVKNFKENTKSLHGTGGMKSKLYASFIASSAGIDTLIMSGKDKKSLNALITGNLKGTLVSSSIDKINKKKHWLLFGMEKAGEIVADEGALKAITYQNKSLLASGIVKIKGDFKKGDGIYIVNEKGIVFSKGIANLDSEDIKKIKGLSSGEIKSKFGKEKISSLVVHKDKMAVSV